MNRKSTIVTNNPAVYEKYKDKRDVEFLDGKTYPEVLEFVRDAIHRGHKLLSHPLSGSVKPNETPYKSVMISKDIGEFDEDGVLIMEDAITTMKKFLNDRVLSDWPEHILDDFQTIDLSLMENTIDKLGH